MLTEASNSLVTHNSLPSGVNAKRRGRLPTTILALGSVAVGSTTCTKFATSEVT